MDSDSSFYYQTTYSEDERYRDYRKQKIEEERLTKEKNDEHRETYFKTLYKQLSSNKQSIFHLEGLNFIKYTHKRIKFSFEPSKVVQFVSRRTIFYCSLRYRNGFWRVKRDSIPVTYKRRIYNMFYIDNYFAVTDLQVNNVLYLIYEKLVQWAEEEHEYRQIKFQRYYLGEDVILDSDDEELFLSDDEIERRHTDREIIWQRMLPPKKKRRYGK